MSYVYPPVYIGATASAAAVAGLVPPASVSQRQRLFRGDGQWTDEVILGDGTSATPAIRFASDPDTGLFWTGIANRIGVSLGGVESATFRGNGSGGFEIAAGGTNQNITWTPSGTGTVNTAASIYLTTVGATVRFFTSGSDYVGARVTGNIFQLGGGGTVFPTSGYEFFTAASTGLKIVAGGKMLLGTITDSSNGAFQLASHTAATGGIGFGTDQSLFRATANDLVFKGNSGRNLYLYSDATFTGLMDAAGLAGRGVLMTATALIFTTGAGSTALTIDSSQVSTFASNVVWGAGNAAVWSTRGAIQFGASGVMMVSNSAGTDFGRLQLGGTTSSFPSFKRSGTSIIARLADDSANTTLAALQFQTDNPSGGTAAPWKLGSSITSGTSVLDTTGYVEVDISGTLVKLARVTNS